MLEVVLDALVDSLKSFPYVFFIYILMEIIETLTQKEKVERAMEGVYAPLVASAFGVIPECGFSVMCAKLYENGLIKIGTLVCAFLATSDEGLVVLISSGTPANLIVRLIFEKVLYAIFVGILLNILIGNIGNKHHCSYNGECIECGEHQESVFGRFILHPFMHATKTFLYIIVFNFIFGFLFYIIGEQNIYSFMSNNILLQPVLSGIVGLVPNCASSIILSEAFTEGVLSYSGLIAGLSTNAGIGLLILFREKKNIKNALIIAGLTFVFGIILGYITLL